MRLSLGYPSEDDEEALVARGSTVTGAGLLEPGVSSTEVMSAIQESCRVRLNEEVRHYLVRVTRATREDQDVRLGASPRASLALHRASQAWAAMHGRDFVPPDDVKRLA